MPFFIDMKQTENEILLLQNDIAYTICTMDPIYCMVYSPYSVVPHIYFSIL